MIFEETCHAKLTHSLQIYKLRGRSLGTTGQEAKKGPRTELSVRETGENISPEGQYEKRSR